MAIDVASAVGASGWATTQELLQRVSRRTLATWVATGKLVQLRPGVLALPGWADQWRVRLAAALKGREAVASHCTALALWELIDHPPGPVHITVDNGMSARGAAGVVIHRSPRIYEERRRAFGLAVTSVERSIVDSWGQPGCVRRTAIRAVAITAVRRRLCAPRDLAFELARRPRLAGRAELGRLTRLLADGCQSELEIWGCLNVLRGPGMPPFVQQRRVAVGGEGFVLDAAYDEVKLAVEMDGAAWHGSREQREKDIRRDALLATIGWQTLRFGFTRMTQRPDACRRDIRSTYEARLRLIWGDGVR